MLVQVWAGYRAAVAPECRFGARVPVLVGARSVRVWQSGEAGEDLGEQVIAGWQPKGEAARVADQASRDGEPRSGKTRGERVAGRPSPCGHRD
jgi:hypothetical protein